MICIKHKYRAMHAHGTPNAGQYTGTFMVAGRWDRTRSGPRRALPSIDGKSGIGWNQLGHGEARCMC